ncbi:MAG: hypothetical protein CME64_01860 [Halobacteriovoraceae bacterium]|nr:hypothetical protein [Halobacteriovoraceae bacterium]|tara:strand:- start:46218 stop:47882 length:1665 start_codon:yes stop_codon:yes gene_type:complete
MKRLIVLTFSVFLGVSCGKVDFDLLNEKLNELSADEVVTLIEDHEQTITLNYEQSFTATSCTITSLTGAAVTTPCSCSAGVCTVGITPNGLGDISLLYSVSDGGTNSDSSDVQATVKEVVPFKSTWRVGDPSYGDGDRTVTLPLRSGFNYNFTVDWGDGNVGEVTSHDDPDIDHLYDDPGDYQITITGLVEAWNFANTGDKDKILSIEELGTVGWRSFYDAFWGCNNLTVVSGGDTSNVVEMDWMFDRAPLANPDTSDWNTSNVRSMAGVFFGASTANPDVSKWDVSNVRNMMSLFFDAPNANPDVSNWDTSNVENMKWMFVRAYAANPDVSKWDTSSVTNMAEMFYDADAADPDVSNWDTSNVTDMNGMFEYTAIANPDVSNWDMSNVTNISGMFFQTSAANPDVSNWDVSSVTNMDSVFSNTAVADPDVSNWNTVSVTNMRAVFYSADAANPDVSMWNTSNVTTMESMFYFADFANPDMSNWDFSSVTNVNGMFEGVTTLSTTNYNNLLIRMEATAPDSLNFHGGSATCSGAGCTARNNLDTVKNWNITDGV